MFSYCDIRALLELFSGLCANRCGQRVFPTLSVPKPKAKGIIGTTFFFSVRTLRYRTLLPHLLLWIPTSLVVLACYLSLPGISLLAMHLLSKQLHRTAVESACR